MWPRLDQPHCTSGCAAGFRWHRMKSMGPRDPILATGFPLHGETQAGVAVEQNVGGLVGTGFHREMAVSDGHSDLGQARPSELGICKGLE